MRGGGVRGVGWGDRGRVRGAGRVGWGEIRGVMGQCEDGVKGWGESGGGRGMG